MPLSDRYSSHALTVMSLLTLLSFADIGNQNNQTFWVAVRAVGLGCAAGAVYGYRKSASNLELDDEASRLLEAVAEVKQGYDWEKYTLQIQHLRELEQHERVIVQLQQQLVEMEAAYVEQREAEQDKLAIAQHHLQQAREKLTQENALLNQQFETQQQSLIERETQFETTLRDQVAAAEAQIAEQEAQMRAGFEALWLERETELQGEIAAQIAQITDLLNQIEQLRYHAYTLMQSDKTEGMTNEELLADRVIDYLHQHGLIVKAPQATAYGKHKFRLSFSIQPIAPGKNDKNHYATSLVDAGSAILGRAERNKLK